MKTAHKIYKKGLQGRFRRDPNFSNKLVLAASLVHAKAKSMAAVSWCPPRMQRLLLARFSVIHPESSLSQWR